MKTPVILLLAFIVAMGTAFSQESKAEYVLRLLPGTEKQGDKLALRCKEAALKALDKSSRVNVIFDEKSQAAATHLLEAGVAYEVLKNELTPGKFVDSTKTAQFSYEYIIEGKVELLATFVEDGRVAGKALITSKGKINQDFKLKYEQVGWAKGMNMSDEKVKQAVLEKARNALLGQLPDIYKNGQDRMVGGMDEVGRGAHHKLFPYRVKVLEATEVKGDKAKTLKIEAGTAFDLIKGDELMLYTLKEVATGGKTYERFELLGRAAAAKIGEKDGLFDVEKGKTAVLEALNAKKTVYASPEKPLTISKATEGLNLAIAAFVTPTAFSKKHREDTYRRLRFNTMGKQGYTLLERENLSALNAEKELQKQDRFIDKALIEQYKAVGADLLLEVICENLLNDIKPSSENGARAASARVSLDYLLRLVSVETGEILGEKKIPFSKYYSHTMMEQDPVLAQYNKDASIGPQFFMEDAIKQLNINPAAFLDEMLPPRVLLVEVTDEKKGRADEVLCVGDFDFKSLDKWNVVRKKLVNVEGQELIRFEPIGVVSFRESEGAGVVNAKVKDGGEQILAAMKAGETLYVMDKPNWAERWNASYLYKHGY
jgi:hypothetical protein